MNTLVTCPCGHTLEQHDTGGCDGDRLRPCFCRRDRSLALEAAVGEVRSKPFAATYELQSGTFDGQPKGAA